MSILLYKCLRQNKNKKGLTPVKEIDLTCHDII